MFRPLRPCSMVHRVCGSWGLHGLRGCHNAMRWRYRQQEIDHTSFARIISSIGNFCLPKPCWFNGSEAFGILNAELGCFRVTHVHCLGSVCWSISHEFYEVYLLPINHVHCFGGLFCSIACRKCFMAHRPLSMGFLACLGCHIARYMDYGFDLWTTWHFLRQI